MYLYFHRDTLSNTVFSPEEETQDKPSEAVMHKPIGYTSNDSLSEVVKKLNYPQVSEYSSKFFIDSNVDSVNGDESEDSDSSDECSKESTGVKFNDDSLDIVFEHSVTNNNSSVKCNDDSVDIVFKNSVNGSSSGSKLEEENSFEILFQKPSDVSEMTCDSTKDSLSNSEHLGVLSDSNICHEQTDDSLSVLFKNSTSKSENDSPIQNSQNTTSAYSSQVIKDQRNDTNQDSLLGDGNLKRRRVQSQPAQGNKVGGDERPRTLSLGVDATASKLKVEPSLRPKTFLYIQMELCQKESLKDWLLKNCGPRKEKVIYSMFNDIIRAVEYVHDNQLMHRDLKVCTSEFFRLCKMQEPTH